jgi:ubiquinone/menaquinone biosynthesis C-methylase UbiE
MQNNLPSEFARQANQMAIAPAFHVREGLQRLVKAVGEAKSSRVLDLACGPGIVAQALAGQVRQIVGIDATPAMLRLAREKLAGSKTSNGCFGVALAEKLPFKSHSFDQVVTRLSIHHFQEVGVVLSEAKRVMTRGGRLVLADVVSSELREESVLHNSLEHLRDPTHVRMLTPSELVEMVRSAGLEILQQETWQQPRAFAEWAAIIADPGRTAPLEVVMRILARTGHHAGIGLKEDMGGLVFTHTWTMLVAREI